MNGKAVAESPILDSVVSLETRYVGPDFLETSAHDYRLFRNLSGPFDYSKFTTGVAIFDRDNEGDVNQVTSYVTDIFQRYFASEVSRSLT
jgi:hypothetical protein